MARGRQFPLRSQSLRRQTSWGVGCSSSDQFITASDLTLWTLGSALTTETKVTIVRIRGFVNLTLEAVAALGDGFTGAVGIGVASSAAFTAGVAAIPTPLTEIGWPGWIWHQLFGIRAVTATIADGANAQGAVLRMEIDSKAMRKFGTDQILYGCIEVVEQGTATIEMHARTRVLDKLS